MLAEGASPQEVLAAITDPVFDPDFSKQQYGIVALGFEDKAVAYTGADTPGSKGDLRDYGVSVQGNILTDEKVVNNALAAFEKAAKNQKDEFSRPSDGGSGSRDERQRRRPALRKAEGALGIHHSGESGGDG